MTKRLHIPKMLLDNLRRAFAAPVDPDDIPDLPDASDLAELAEQGAVVVFPAQHSRQRKPGQGDENIGKSNGA